MQSQIVVSKSQFKAQLLEYLRNVEKNKQPVIVTHGKKPVIKVVPYKQEDSEDESILKSLRGTLKYYKDPDEPVGFEDWDALK